MDKSLPTSSTGRSRTGVYLLLLLLPHSQPFIPPPPPTNSGKGDWIAKAASRS